MPLPTTSQIASATRHVASFAGGAVAMFGLSKAIDPAKLQAAIEALGTLGQDLVTVIGLLTPIISGIIAWRSASLKSQMTAVAANPDVQRIVVTSQAIADAAPAKVVTPTDIAKGAAIPLTPAVDPNAGNFSDSQR